MLQPIYQYGLPAQLSATGLVYTGQGCVQGIVVNSNSSGTLKLWDNTSAATTVLFDTYTFPAGSSSVNLFGAKFHVGLFATIGGTLDATLIYTPYQG